MPITINGSGTVTGISVGGLPDGIVDTDMIANSAVTSAKSSGLGGLTEADLWRLTTSFVGDADPITSNLERVDTNAAGHLGTGMSHSSGVFTFPSTGFWLITFTANYLNNGGSSENVNRIEVTTDNGSNWLNGGFSSCAIGDKSQNWCVSATTHHLLDVTDTTNVKVRFSCGVQNNNVTVRGDTGENLTSFSFLKLGDT